MRRTGILAIVAAAALMGAGCTTTGGGKEISITNPFVITPERPLTDVPVPTGFTYKSKDSYVFSGNYRVAKLVYRGGAHIDACVAYFKQQMPVSNWAFVKDSSTDGRVVTFHNEAEEMRIIFDRQAGLTHMAIEIKPRPV